jgi:hypothetical protein
MLHVSSTPRKNVTETVERAGALLQIKWLKFGCEHAKVEYIIGTHIYEYFDQIS